MSLKEHNVRKISSIILFDALIKKELLNNSLYEKYEKNDISTEDKAFLKRECTGVIENIEYIDSIINKYSKVKTHKLDDDILIIFRIAVYELYFMDKVPIYATINESVGLVKDSKNNKLSGYVNAVLRNIVRHENIKKEEPSKNKVVKKCYFRIFGDNEQKVLNELTKKNINFQKYDGKLEFKYSKVYFTTSYKYILDLESFINGLIIIEDASSVYLVDSIKKFIDKYINDEEIRILDTCSAPGGKILSLMDLLRDNNVLAVARDLTKEKIKIINDNINRLNMKNITPSVCDATVFNSEDICKYDVVMCDVPCTGLGVINKKPDILLNFTDEKKDSLVKIQKKILEISKEYVKNGGILSYSTCTITREENEDIIEDFLKKNNNFETVFEKRIDLNDENLSDGFYMNIMKRND